MRWRSELALGGASGACHGSHERALPLDDRDAMGALLAQHAPTLRAVALRYVRDPLHPGDRCGEAGDEDAPAGAVHDLLEGRNDVVLTPGESGDLGVRAVGHLRLSGGPH